MKLCTSVAARAIYVVLVLAILVAVFPAVQLNAKTNGPVAEFRIQLLLLDADGALDATQPIAYEIATSSSNQSTFIFLPEDRYFCQTELLSTNGIAISKTSIGIQFGALFEELDPNPKYIRDQGPFSVFHVSTNEMKTRRLKLLNGRVVGPSLLRPVDLFDITNSGEYLLKLHFQILEWTNGANPKVIKLPVIEMKVHKL